MLQKIQQKYSCAMSQSNRPLAWFLRPIKNGHKLLFRCAHLSCNWTRISTNHSIFQFCCCKEDELAALSGISAITNPAFVSVSFYLCIEYTLGVRKIFLFFKQNSLALQQHLAGVNAWKKICIQICRFSKSFNSGIGMTL